MAPAQPVMAPPLDGLLKRRLNRRSGRLFASLVSPLMLLGGTLPADGNPQSKTSLRPLLTEISAIRQLPNDPSADGFPVQVRGVVTFTNNNFLGFIQDDSQGGAVYFPPKDASISFGDFPSPLEAGMYVEIRGRTVAGKFAPHLGSPVEITVLGKKEHPKPVFPTGGHLLDPSFHCKWIYVGAMVHGVRLSNERSPPMLELDLTTSGERFKGYVLGDWGKTLPDDLLHSQINATGVFGSIFNTERQLTGARLFIPSIEFIKNRDPRSENAFGKKPKQIAEISTFNPNRSKWIRVAGTVLGSTPDGTVFVEDRDGAGLRVENYGSQPFTRGDLVDVYGRVLIRGTRPSVLVDTVIRTTGKGGSPEALPFSPRSDIPAEYDARLLDIEAQVVDQFDLSGDSLLVLDALGRRIRALVLGGAKTIKPASQVSVRGIGEWDSLPGGGSRDMRLSTFRLLVDSEKDIAILRSPPWLTRKRVLNILIALSLGALLAVVWALALQRKVRQQTLLIESKVEKEKVMEERTRIARELHDTLEQELVGITMQLDTTSARLESSPEKAKQVIDRARAMLRHSQEEARRSVWDLRTDPEPGETLGDELERLSKQLTSEEGPEIMVSVPEGIPPLAQRDERHLLRIARESINNALKHSGATVIEVRLTHGDNHTHLEISDDGKGFARESAPAFSEGHFGLLGMEERTAKIGGSFTLESSPGTGTRITVSVPENPTHASAVNSLT